MNNTKELQELNDEIKDELENVDYLINLQYLAEEYHTTRSIKLACDLADMLYDFFFNN